MKERTSLLGLARRATLPLATAGILAAGAAPGCFGATEIQVEVTTNVTCLPGAALTTQIFTGATGTGDFGTAPAAETDRCEPDEPRVGTLSIVPRAARDGRFDLEVVGAVGVKVGDCRSIMTAAASAGASAAPTMTGCIVARRRVSFRPHKALTFPILLDKSCIGVPCGSDETCDVGICSPTSACDETGCPRERVAAPATVMDGSVPADSAADASDAGDAGPPPFCGAVPEVVVDHQSVRGPLAMQGADLFYVNRVQGATVSEVRRVAAAGGAVMAVASGNIDAVAATDTAIAWVLRQSTVQSAVVVESAGTTRQSPDATFVTAALAFAGDGLVGFSPTDAFSFSPMVGGTAIGTASTSGNAGAVTEVVVDADGQYYAVVGAKAILHYDRPATGSIRQLGRANPGTVGPDIAVANGMLYAAIEPADPMMSKGIYRIARDTITGTFVPTAPWLPLPIPALVTSMTADERSLYYVAGADLVRVDLASTPTSDPSAATTLPGKAVDGADRLTVDGHCVYWVESGGTRIMKQAK